MNRHERTVDGSLTHTHLKFEWQDGPPAIVVAHHVRGLAATAESEGLGQIVISRVVDVDRVKHVGIDCSNDLARPVQWAVSAFLAGAQAEMNR